MIEVEGKEAGEAGEDLGLEVAEEVVPEMVDAGVETASACRILWLYNLIP